MDGLRALAVLAVISYHLSSSLLPAGFLGVDVFFVISGFVVTASLARNPPTSFCDFASGFYSRRLARIVPALLVTLLVTTVAYALLVPRAWLSGSTQSVAGAAFWGFSNWVLANNSDGYFEPRAEFNPYTHTWSLGVEEQFYLLAPLLVFAWLRGRAVGRGRTPMFIMAVIAIVSLLGCLRMAFHYGANTVFYSIVFRFWELAAGVLLYEITCADASATPKIPLKARTYAFLGVLGLGLVAGAMLVGNAALTPWPTVPAAVLGTMMLIGNARQVNNDVVRRLFALPQLVWIGERSYSLYLWHWPTFVLFRWTIGLESVAHRLLALLVATVLAVFSYAWLETPIRESRTIKAYRPMLRVAGFLAAICVCWYTAESLLSNQDAISLSRVARNASEWYPTERMPFPSHQHACKPIFDADTLLGIVSRVEYLLPDCNSVADWRLFVIGDSHANAYLPLFEELAGRDGVRVRVYQIPGCGYAEFVRLNEDKPARCSRAAQATAKDVLATAKPGDVVFLPGLRLPRLIDQWGPAARPSGDEMRQSQAEIDKLVVGTAQARAWIAPFLDGGLRVILEAPKPLFRAPIFRCVDSFNHTNPHCARGFQETRADERTYRAPTVHSMQKLAHEMPGVTIWDPFPVLCPGTICSAFRGDHPLYFDADHISAYANGLLLDSFRDTVRSVEYDTKLRLLGPK